MGIVYAVVRNGMWDDPAVANTGNIARKYTQITETEFFTVGRVAPYLTWRFCYLVCGLLFGLARVIVGYPGQIDAAGDMYRAFLAKQLPGSIDASRFDTFVDVLTYEEIAVWVMITISFLLTVASTCAASPVRPLRCAACSRRLLWIAWLAAFLPPFAFFLTFPVRSFIDWNGVVADICTSSVDSVFKMPGSTLESTLNFVSDAGMADKSLELVLSDTKEYCKQQGANWHDEFYDTTVACSWQLEDECRNEYCKGAAELDLVRCLTRCLAYASNASQQGSSPQPAGTSSQPGVQPSPPPQNNDYVELQLERIKTCTNSSRSFVLVPPAVDLSFNSTEDAMTQLYSQSQFTSRTLIVEGSETATLASTQAEYVGKGTNTSP